MAVAVADDHLRERRSLTTVATTPSMKCWLIRNVVLLSFINRSVRVSDLQRTYTVSYTPRFQSMFNIRLLSTIGSMTELTFLQLGSVVNSVSYRIRVSYL